MLGTKALRVSCTARTRGAAIGLGVTLVVCALTAAKLAPNGRDVACESVGYRRRTHTRGKQSRNLGQLVRLEVCKSLHGLSLSVFEPPKDYRHEPTLLQSFLTAEKRAIRTGIQVLLEIDFTHKYDVAPVNTYFQDKVVCHKTISLIQELSLTSANAATIRPVANE